MRHSQPTERRSHFDAIETVLLLGAVALITMPASDPPASRYVDIPVNRR